MKRKKEENKAKGTRKKYSFRNFQEFKICKIFKEGQSAHRPKYCEIEQTR